MSLLTRRTTTPTGPSAAVAGADGLTLHRRARREIVSEARKTASAGWLPQPDQVEPPHLLVLDHEAAGAAQATLERHHDRQREPLATMRVWLRAVPVPPPAPGRSGPEARHQDRGAQLYQRQTDDAERALTAYDQEREAIAAQLGRIAAYRETARTTFWTVLAEYHPTPQHLPVVERGAADPSVPPPEHPDATETRARLRLLRYGDR